MGCMYVYISMHHRLAMRWVHLPRTEPLTYLTPLLEHGKPFHCTTTTDHYH